MRRYITDRAVRASVLAGLVIAAMNLAAPSGWFAVIWLAWAVVAATAIVSAHRTITRHG